MNVAVGTGHGKLILLGEHAVVYGQPALAAALDRGVRCVATAADGPLRLSVPAWAIDVGIDDDHPVARALAAIAARFDVHDGLRLDAEAGIPPAAGLGSSAAFAVAVTRALAGAAGRHLDDDQVAAIADAAERCFHGNPSGVDVALASRGGVGIYRRGAGLEPLRCARLPVLLGFSGEPRSTAAMVARVAAARTGDDDPRLIALGNAALEAAEILRSDTGEVAALLGPMLTSAHRTLASFGISTPSLDALVDDALAAGAHGAKLTGAGGGGAVLALAPADRSDAVLAAWRARGHTALACSIGGTSR